jgi:hypothetical protein
MNAETRTSHLAKSNHGRYQELPSRELVAQQSVLDPEQLFRLGV